MISFAVLIFVPLVLLTSIAYIRVSENSERQIKFASSQAFDQANKFVNYKVNTMIQASDIIYFNGDIQPILKRDRAMYEHDMVQQARDMAYIDNFLYSLKSKENVYRVKIYVPEWFFYANQQVNFDRLDLFTQSPAYMRLIEKKGKVLWLPPEEVVQDNKFNSSVSVISLVRKISDFNILGEDIGYMKISMLQRTLDDIIVKANITKSGVVYIQNSYNELISISDKEKYENLKIQAALAPNIGEDSEEWSEIRIDSKKYIFKSQTIEDTDWEIVAVIPYDEVLAQGRSIRNIMWILAAAVGIIAYGFAYYFSKSFTGRIALLSDSMEKVQHGALDVRVHTEEQDEIGTLFESFNYMIQRINVLVEEQFQTGKEMKNAELKALQAQINPHFLYNTLDMINWKALDKGVPEIANISQTLARFYKLSLNKGRDVVTIRDEVAHIDTYIKIQNMRFENRIHFDNRLDEGFYEYAILKIILQPLVENAIMHGILKKAGSEGTITLDGRLDGEDLELTISDDGVGMGIAQDEANLPVFNTTEMHGYGVRNIHDRMQLSYGTAYGLSYESEIGVGTKVRIKIPALKLTDV